MMNIPSRASIVLAQQNLLREIGIRDNKFAKCACWACISENGKPIRAIISHALDDLSPRSYFLLCHNCQLSRPPDDSKSAQIEWIIEVSTSPSFENVSFEFAKQTNVSLLDFVSQLKRSLGIENLAGYLTHKLTYEMLKTSGTRREAFLQVLLKEFAATTKRGNQSH
jgi:hypothetical protein